MNRIHIFQCIVKIFCVEILKGYLGNSTENILPIHWKIQFSCSIEILRALRFKSSYAFLAATKQLYKWYFQSVCPSVLPGGRSCWGRLPWITRTDIDPETSCGCQLMMVVGIVILYWATMVVGSRNFNASHRRSTGWLLLWWWAAVVFSCDQAA